MGNLKEAVKENCGFLVEVYRSVKGFIIEQEQLYYAVLCIKSFLNKKYNVNKYKIISVKEFCEKYKCRYLLSEERKFREICKPHYYERQNPEATERYMSPEIYVAELPDVMIVGANGVIIADNYCLYDIAASDKENRYDLRFESVEIINENYAAIEYVENDQVIEEGIFLIGFAPSNYYHLTVEILSRLQYIDQFEEYRKLPLIIDKVVFKVPQYKALLEKINTYGHPVIQVEPRKNYKVRKLVYPSCNTWMPTNVKKGRLFKGADFMVAESAVEYIRNTVLKGIETVPHRRIFISRKNTGNARLVNEEKVRELFRKYDFEIIYPEDLSFEEQAKTFSEAEYVAGSTGAALTNIVYCSSEATVICIIPEEFNFFLYSTIAKIINVKSEYLNAKIIKRGKNLSMDQFELDLNYCESFLKTI